MTKMKSSTPKANRILNDLAEANFKTPPELEFIRYGRRRDADYKLSKHPETEMHFIEVVHEGKYFSAYKANWNAANNHLIYLCQKFGKPKAVAS